MKIILASKSPRRSEILSQMGLKFSVRCSNFDENSIQETEPEEYCKIVAWHKAKDIAEKFDHAVVIAADTIVVLDGKILGKPNSEESAINMLKSLSGKWHKVITAFSIMQKIQNFEHFALEETLVKFRQLGAEEIVAYVRECQPLDKAGAYGIQDIKYSLVEKIDGCYFNVVGFPATHFYKVWNEINRKLKNDSE